MLPQGAPVGHPIHHKIPTRDPEKCSGSLWIPTRAGSRVGFITRARGGGGGGGAAAAARAAANTTEQLLLFALLLFCFYILHQESYTGHRAARNDRTPRRVCTYNVQGARLLMARSC
jgi:hypothetical protein